MRNPFDGESALPMAVVHGKIAYKEMRNCKDENRGIADENRRF